MRSYTKRCVLAAFFVASSVLFAVPAVLVLGSSTVRAADGFVGTVQWKETNPSSIGVSYYCKSVVDGPGVSPYKVDMSVWATIADSNGTVVASYTSPVVVDSGTIDFTLTYDIPKAEQAVYWPDGQPLPSGPVELTFVGTIHTHRDSVDGSVHDGEEQYTFTIYPTLYVTVPATPTPRPTARPTARPTETPSPEPTPEPSLTDTPSPTATASPPPSPSPTVTKSADPILLVAGAQSTGSGGQGWGGAWLIWPFIALIAVALVLRSRRAASHTTQRGATETAPEHAVELTVTKEGAE